jgi:hypothetical protein
MSFPGSPFRNIAEARVLKDQLSLRLGSGSTTYVVNASQDSNGNPVLTVQPSGSFTWGTGAQFAVIQVAMNGNLNQVDALGNTQTVYTPEIINVIVEGNTVGSGSPEPASSDYNSVLGFQFELTILGAVLGFGTKVQVWNSGHGVQPVLATLSTASNLVASFDDLFNPLTGTM